MNLKIIAPIHYFYDSPRDRLPESIQLEDNFILTKFDPGIIEIVTNLFTDLYSKHDVRDLENCRFCAIYNFDDDVVTRDEAQNKVHRLIESVRVVRPTRAVCSTFLFSTDEAGNLSPVGASQKSSTISLVEGQPVGSQHFKTEDATEIQKYYSKTINLYQRHSGSYNRVLNAFIFFQLGYLTNYAKLRILPFTTALESLFNTSEQEVGYSLRMRCSVFLGESRPEREALIKKLKDIYQFRSAVVHGSSLPKKVLRNPAQANEILRDSEDLCRKCLQKIFNEDLEDLFSQDKDKLSNELDKLLL